jgi:hypothetical protein
MSKYPGCEFYEKSLWLVGEDSAGPTRELLEIVHKLL